MTETATLSPVEMEKQAVAQAFTSEQNSSLVIRTEVLKSAIKKISSTLRPHTTLSILTGIYLHANEERVLLRAANSDFYSELVIDDMESFMVKGGEAALVFPGKQFADIINRMTGKNVTIEFKGLWTTIKSGGAKPTLAGQHHDEYPRFPEVDPQASFSMSASKLLHMYHKTMYAVSNSETRPVLTGVNHQIADKEFRCVVTDSHRLARIYHNMEVNINDVNLTIPGSTIKEVIKHLAQSELVEITFDEQHVIYKMDGITLYSRVLEDNYPATDRLIPPNFNTTAQFIVEDLVSMLDRVSIYKDKDQTAALASMIIRAEDKQMRTLSSKTEMGQAKEDLIISKSVGDNIVLTSSVKFLLDALKTYDMNDEVELCFVKNTMPFVIRSLNGDNRNLDLILPVRTANEVSDEIKDFNPGDQEDDELKNRAKKYAAAAENVQESEVA